jgi:hypothetical protein
MYDPDSTPTVMMSRETLLALVGGTATPAPPRGPSPAAVLAAVGVFQLTLAAASVCVAVALALLR